LLPALCSINFQLYTRFRGQQQEADAAWHHEFFLKCGLEPAVLENAFLFSYASVIDRINHFCTVLTTAEHDGADWQSTLQQNFSLVQEPIAILHALLAPGTPLRDELGNKIAKAIAHYSINSCTRQENFEAAVEWLQIALPYATFRPLQDQIQEKIQLAQKQLEHPPCWFCSDYLSNPNSVLWYRVWLNLGNALCFRALPHTMKVEITRCPRCKAVHRQRRLLNLAGLVLGGLLGLAGSVVIYPEMFHTIQHTMLWPLVPGLGMGIGAGRWMESRMSSAIVKSEAESASHPAVQQCLDTWNLNPSLMRKSHKMGYDKQ
ncbi:MAG: hypothetical protein RBU29_17570, partial [bacterium]|nr:hypothetical protein [bacterium]